MKPKRITFFGWALRATYLYVAAYIGLHWLVSPAGERGIQILYSAVPVVVSSVAVAAAFKAWRTFRTREQRAWGTLWLGVGMWWAAEVIWLVLTLAWGDEVPYPSLADALWLGGYFPLGAAILVYLRYHRFALTLPKEVFALVFGAVIPLVLLFNLVPPSNVSSPAASSLLTTEALYPPLDMLIATGALLCILASPRKLWDRPWFLIGSGMAIFAYSDLWYWLLLYLGMYDTDLLSAIRVDIPYGLAYILVAIGCVQALVEEGALRTHPLTPRAH